MSLRIIGGQFRNRLLKTPKGPQTRPSLGILRKAVFDILQEEIIDANFLDLFAGAGSMGLEALSRGAKHATFVDLDRYALSCIRENIATLNVGQECTILQSDASVALSRLGKKQEQFDIVYIDPPYAASAQKSLLLSLLSQLETQNLLKENAIVFAEEGAPQHLKPNELHLSCLRFVNSRQFSQSILHQFRKAAEAN